jgi:hypothetical protein
MLRRAAGLLASGVQFICLLALSDNGAPGYNSGNAAALANMGVPSFACTPDAFPALMAAAMAQRSQQVQQQRPRSPFQFAALRPSGSLPPARPCFQRSPLGAWLSAGARVWRDWLSDARSLQAGEKSVVRSVSQLPVQR